MKNKVWNIYLLALGGFLAGTSEFVIAGILDVIANDLNITLSAAGQLVTVFSLVFALGTPLLVAATSRIERKTLLMVTLLIFAFGNFLPVFSQGVWGLWASRVILALCSGVFTVAALTLAAHLSPPEKRGGAIASIIMGFSSSLVIGVPLGRVCANLFDWHDMFVGIGIGGILILLGIFKWIPKLDGQETVPIRVQLSVLKDRRVSSALMVTFFWIMGYSIVYTYLSPYLLTHDHIASSWVSAGLFAFGVFSLIGSRLGGYGADKWGVPTTLITSLLLHVLVLVLFAFMQLPLAIVLTIMMLWSASAWATAPVQQFRLITLSPGASDIVLSLNTSILQAGMAAGAAVGGAIVNGLSVIFIGWAGACSILIACLTAFYSLKIGVKSNSHTVYNATE
ncbi:MFS transporter [Cohnella sp. AR92]|uniref:MFS transporter n=1 Tax=Cohnella sp. AR92 TaxID=648716 RepID=UPI000F8C48D0|nr:MFS transporter [Cohnella sp. AR92]RUS49049.1 MFS transporter [Cohnella sp. AR92]